MSEVVAKQKKKSSTHDRRTNFYPTPYVKKCIEDYLNPAKGSTRQSMNSLLNEAVIYYINKKGGGTLSS